MGDDLRSLAQSSDPQRRELARSVETHYRNANIRASLTEDLLNRLIPQQKMEIAPVRDTVMGLPVRGESMTSTDVALRLVPDPNRVRMALEVTGEVAAMTSSTSGPATFFNDSDSLYAARKPLEIDQKGIKLLPAEVDVRHQTRLRDVATDFDGIPLLGLVARSVARQQHELFRPQVNQEAQSKVANKARQRIDSEAHDRLAELVNNLNRKVFGPLVNLSLEPTMIEAQTTEQRMTMRLRVAGEDQLGSFTPRPQCEKQPGEFPNRRIDAEQCPGAPATGRPDLYPAATGREDFGTVSAPQYLASQSRERRLGSHLRKKRRCNCALPGRASYVDS